VGSTIPATVLRRQASVPDPQRVTLNVLAHPAAWEIMRQVRGSGQFMAPFLPTATSTESGMAHAATD